MRIIECIVIMEFHYADFSLRFANSLLTIINRFHFQLINPWQRDSIENWPYWLIDAIAPIRWRCIKKEKDYSLLGNGKPPSFSGEDFSVELSSLEVVSIRHRLGVVSRQQARRGQNRDRIRVAVINAVRNIQDTFRKRSLIKDRAISRRAFRSRIVAVLETFTEFVSESIANKFTVIAR